MRTPILAEVEQALLADERRSLSALSDALRRLDAPADSIAALARSIEQLDELFLVVIVGEFNSGKSAFINALLGAHVLKSPQGTYTEWRWPPSTSFAKSTSSIRQVPTR